MSIVGQDYYDIKPKFYTFKDLTELGNKYPNHIFRFKETDFYPFCISSWRGSYNIPSLEYGNNAIIGEQLVEMINNDIQEVHEGYKGGEYKYNLSEEPYISAYSRAEEHKVLGYEVSGDEVLLLTEYDPY